MSTPADRARAERAAQGLETPAPASAVRLYATAAAVLFPPVALTTAATPPVRGADTHVAVVNGAGGPAVSVAVGEVSTRNALSATADSAPAARPPAPHTKKARPVAAERTHTPAAG